MITGTYNGIPVKVSQTGTRGLLSIMALDSTMFDGSTSFGGACMTSWRLAYRGSVKNLRRIEEK